MIPVVAFRRAAPIAAVQRRINRRLRRDYWRSRGADTAGGESLRSRDGAGARRAQLYVSFGVASGAPKIAVIDTTLHKLVAFHPVVGDHVTVSRDGSRLFVADGAAVNVYDRTTFTLVMTISAAAPVRDLTASPTLDRLYTVESVQQ